MAKKRDPKPAKRDPKPGKVPAEAKRTRPGAFLLYLSSDERARLEATRARLEAEETARHGIRRAVALADVVRMALAKFTDPAPPSGSRGSPGAAPTAPTAAPEPPEAPVLAALAELAGDRPGGTTPPEAEESTPEPTPPTPEPLAARVLAAVTQLAARRRGGTVSLDDLRGALPDLARADLDAAVAELRRSGALAPERGAP